MIIPDGKKGKPIDPPSVFDHFYFDKPITLRLKSAENVFKILDDFRHEYGSMMSSRDNVKKRKKLFGKEIELIGYIVGKGKHGLPPGKYLIPKNSDGYRLWEGYFEEIILEEELFEI